MSHDMTQIGNLQLTKHTFLQIKEELMFSQYSKHLS